MMKQDDRDRQVGRYKMLLCVAAGAAAGVLITFIAARGVVTEHEKTLTAQNTELSQENETLSQENEELRTQKNKLEAAEDSAGLLSSDSENWAIALVNEGHPLDTSYVPAELTEIETERSVDARIAEDLEQMLSDSGRCSTLRCRTGSLRGTALSMRTMRRESQWRCPGPANMLPGWQWILFLHSIKNWMINRGIRQSRNGSWNTAGNMDLSSAIRWTSRM